LADWPAPGAGDDPTMPTGVWSQILARMPPTLTVTDALIQPGESARMSIGLGRGFGTATVKSYGGRTVVVTDADGREVLRNKSNEKGEVLFEKRFDRPGNYFFHVAVEGQVDEKTVAAVLFGVYVREEAAPLAVFDLDKTLVASGFGQVMAGGAKPFDHSSDVLWRLVREKGLTVVYLTHRPDFFGPSSKYWLRKNKFPPGPLYTSGLSEYLKGSQNFKGGQLARIRKRFPNITLGVGDKPSDMAVYLENQARGLMIPDLDWSRTKAEYWRDRLRELQGLKPEVNVCRNWQEMEEVLFGGQTYPPERLIQSVKEMMTPAPPKAAVTDTK
jgi:hypothetical protein